MPASFSLTAEQRAAFEASGVLHLRGLLPAAEAAAMARALWDDLSQRFGARPGRPETWKEARPAQFQALTRRGAFDPFDACAVALADDLHGDGSWTRAFRGGQPLVTLPSPGGVWDIPHNHWHFDVPVDREAEEPVVRVFTFLEPVRPRGGGTLVAAGSHRVTRRLAEAEGVVLKSSEARKRLRRIPWFDALFSPGGGDRVQRFMDEGDSVEGIPVRVEEMTGEPGDVVLMDPGLLHAAAPNSLNRPRMMLTQWLTRDA
jgi:hypothetical protein